MNRKERLAYSKNWYEAHKKEQAVAKHKYYIAHREKLLAYSKNWYEKHKERHNRAAKKYIAKHPIWLSLKAHHGFIFNPNHASHKFYKGMPFEPRWDPRKGGSYLVGEKELLSTIGPKPYKTASLHVVHHDKGIILGNLVWATKQIQNCEQMYKIIANLRHENAFLRKQLTEKNK
jgi:hypothetical protein